MRDIGKKVAIIGAGPAGLACADVLARNVYVYDERGGRVLEEKVFDLLPGKELIIKILDYEYEPDESKMKILYLK